MKGVASSIIVIAIVAILLVVLVYSYYQSSGSPSLPTTGRAITTVDNNGDSKLGLLESCNPNRDRCDNGLVCKLDRENVYRCLRP